MISGSLGIRFNYPSTCPHPTPHSFPLSPPYSTYQFLFISPHATQLYRSKLIFFELPPPLLLFPFSLWTSSHYQTQLRTRTIFIGSRRFEEPSIGCQHITAKQMKTKQKTSITGGKTEKRKSLCGHVWQPKHKQEYIDFFAV